jgi:hypothetical protein
LFDVVITSKVHDLFIRKAFNGSMAMTLTQLEHYMVSEIENLHAKLDAFIARMDTVIAGMEARLQYIERMTDEHGLLLGVLESSKK